MTFCGGEKNRLEFLFLCNLDPTERDKFQILAVMTLTSSSSDQTDKSLSQTGEVISGWTALIGFVAASVQGSPTEETHFSPKR